jgi:hypothetical protein
LEQAQEVNVETVIQKITRYDMRRAEDFDKYDALSLAELTLIASPSS